MTELITNATTNTTPNVSFSYSDLKEKVILVTGTMRGIGREIVLSLAKQKSHLVCNYINSEKNIENARVLKDEIESLGGKFTPLTFDISKYDEVNDSISKFLKDGPAITGLVNNAGITKDQLALRIKEEDVSTVIDTNLKGAIYVTSALTRNFMKAQNVSIVNISSVVGLMGNPSQIVYSSSKAGLIGLTKSYAKEMSSKKIRCNAICPGLIETDMTSSLNEKVKEGYLEKIPLGRAGTSREVANLVCFLLSETSSYITGEVIKVDGGLYI
ncbi:MAG: 3-oxoacyl-ACP reductase FabG [Oligoflexia bacterium]|nr:3-oxoacyl-ACP reductase FabG [Oligoflexia bacterium]